MLNRRILRVKAFKLIYAYSLKPSMSLQEALIELDKSCEATRDLYLFMLALISPLTKIAAERIEAAKNKILATEQELNPNMKFANNALARYFDEDSEFQKFLERKKLSWEPYDIILKSLLDSITGKAYFKKYMASEETSLAEDCRLFDKIFREEFQDFPQLDDLLEEVNMYWSDELAYSLTWCCHSLQDISKGMAWRLPELYQSDLLRKRRNVTDMDSDRDFVRRLVSSALSGYEKYFQKVVSLAPEWDSERLFSADMALIALCLAERDTFPGIDARISMNEYLEISKFFCSPKSRQFINGIIDTIIKQNNNSIN